MGRPTDPGAFGGAPGLSWSDVERALRSAAARSVTTVHLLGRPGGLVRLSGGGVVDTWTTGTPLGVPSPDRRGVRRAVDGPARHVAMTDAVFAMAAGEVWGVREETGEPGPAGGPELERVLHEVRRRLSVLAGAGGRPPLRPDTAPVAAADDAGTDWHPLLSASERKLLGLVGAGTTLRDMAFLLDRGLYAVAVDVAHLVDIGLLRIPPRAPVPPPGPPPGPVRARPAAPAAPPNTAPPAPAAPPAPDPVPHAEGGVLAMFSRRRPRGTWLSRWTDGTGGSA